MKKKDGASPFCVDYRKVNSVTEGCIPRMDDLFDTLAGSLLFNTL